ncbi:MAG: hypothetical protein N2C14_01730, partial [Planctomycetales bacterium]
MINSAECCFSWSVIVPTHEVDDLSSGDSPNGKTQFRRVFSTKVPQGFNKHQKLLMKSRMKSIVGIHILKWRQALRNSLVAASRFEVLVYGYSTCFPPRCNPDRRTLS